MIPIRQFQRSLLKQVKGGFGGDNSALFGNIKYDHRGATRQTDAKNGTRTCSWYDNRARLAGMMTGPMTEVSCSDAPDVANPAAFQQLTYDRTPTGLIKTVNDLSPVSPGIPNFSASYEYDRLYQLTKADTPEGTLTYGYDTIQNLVYRRADNAVSTVGNPTQNAGGAIPGLPLGDFGYGEKGAGPNQITSAGDQAFEYNAVGQMKRYNGFELTFDVESRLVEAKKPGQVTIEYHYDDTGEKKLTLIKKPGQKDKVYQYISGGYQIRDGDETWFVSGGQGQVEITKADGLEVTLQLLDEMIEYARDPAGKKKPVPAEYMDLDGDGDLLDMEDLDLAAAGYWNGVAVGDEQLVYRYYHKDHLGGSTVVTDSMGDVVSTMRYHPYGQTAFRSGEKPIYGFAGGEIEEESELGLIRFGARWFAPAIGRWVSGDLFFAESPRNSADKQIQANLYSYASNSPSRFVDPSGREPNLPAKELDKSEVDKAVDKAMDEVGEVVSGALENGKDLAKKELLKLADKGKVEYRKTLFKKDLKGGEVQVVMSFSGTVSLGADGTTKLKGTLSLTGVVSTREIPKLGFGKVRASFSASVHWEKEQVAPTAVSGSISVAVRHETPTAGDKKHAYVTAKAFTEVGAYANWKFPFGKPQSTITAGIYGKMAAEAKFGDWGTIRTSGSVQYEAVRFRLDVNPFSDWDIGNNDTCRERDAWENDGASWVD